MATVLPPSPAPPGVTPFAFPRGDASEPKYTSIRRLHLTGGTHEEPPDEGCVRFYYVLQGEGALSTGDLRASVRPGSALVLKEGETFHLTCVAAPLTLLCVAVREASCPDGQGA